MPIYKDSQNNEIKSGKPFTIDGLQYPANWLELATEEDLARAGIMVEDDQPPPPVDPNKNIMHRLTYTDEQLLLEASRMIEEIAEERDAAGKYVRPEVLALVSERKTLRSQLT